LGAYSAPPNSQLDLRGRFVAGEKDSVERQEGRGGKGRREWK